jgi:IPT/TIG domain
MFRIKDNSPLLAAAVADRILCWARRIGYPLTLLGSAPEVDSVAYRQSVWTVTNSPYGMVVCLDSGLCSYASGVPLQMYASGPDLCPLATTCDKSGHILVTYAEALARDLDCSFQPPPPPPVGPAITGLTPPCIWGWSMSNVTITGQRLSGTTRVQIVGGADPTDFAVLTKNATQVTCCTPEVEDNNGSNYQLVLTTPDGVATFPFRVDRPGGQASC